MGDDLDAKLSTLTGARTPQDGADVGGLRTSSSSALANALTPVQSFASHGKPDVVSLCVVASNLSSLPFQILTSSCPRRERVCACYRPPGNPHSVPPSDNLSSEGMRPPLPMRRRLKLLRSQQASRLSGTALLDLRRCISGTRPHVIATLALRRNER